MASRNIINPKFPNPYENPKNVIAEDTLNKFWSDLRSGDITEIKNTIVNFGLAGKIIDRDLESPFHIVLQEPLEQKKKLEILQLLCNFKIFPSSQNNQALTPLMIASQNQEKEIVNFLLELNGDHIDVDLAGRTPLHMAVMGKDTACSIPDVEKPIEKSSKKRQLVSDVITVSIPILKSDKNQTVKTIDNLLNYNENNPLKNKQDDKDYLDLIIKSSKENYGKKINEFSEKVQAVSLSNIESGLQPFKLIDSKLKFEDFKTKMTLELDRELKQIDIDDKTKIINRIMDLKTDIISDKKLDIFLKELINDTVKEDFFKQLFFVGLANHERINLDIEETHSKSVIDMLFNKLWNEGKINFGDAYIYNDINIDVIQMYTDYRKNNLLINTMYLDTNKNIDFTQIMKENMKMKFKDIIDTKLKDEIVNTLKNSSSIFINNDSNNILNFNIDDILLMYPIIDDKIEIKNWNKIPEYSFIIKKLIVIGIIKYNNTYIYEFDIDIKKIYNEYNLDNYLIQYPDYLKDYKIIYDLILKDYKCPYLLMIIGYISFYYQNKKNITDIGKNVNIFITKIHNDEYNTLYSQIVDNVINQKIYDINKIKNNINITDNSLDLYITMVIELTEYNNIFKKSSIDILINDNTKFNLQKSNEINIITNGSIILEEGIYELSKGVYTFPNNTYIDSNGNKTNKIQPSGDKKITKNASFELPYGEYNIKQNIDNVKFENTIKIPYNKLITFNQDTKIELKKDITYFIEFNDQYTIYYSGFFNNAYYMFCGKDIDIDIYPDEKHENNYFEENIKNIHDTGFIIHNDKEIYINYDGFSDNIDKTKHLKSVVYPNCIYKFKSNVNNLCMLLIKQNNNNRLISFKFLPYYKILDEKNNLITTTLAKKELETISHYKLQQFYEIETLEFNNPIKKDCAKAINDLIKYIIKISLGQAFYEHAKNLNNNLYTNMTDKVIFQLLIDTNIPDEYNKSFQELNKQNNTSKIYDYFNKLLEKNPELYFKFTDILYSPTLTGSDNGLTSKIIDINKFKTEFPKIMSTNPYIPQYFSMIELNKEFYNEDIISMHLSEFLKSMVITIPKDKTYFSPKNNYFQIILNTIKPMNEYNTEIKKLTDKLNEHFKNISNLLQQNQYYYIPQLYLPSVIIEIYNIFEQINKITTIINNYKSNYSTIQGNETNFIDINNKVYDKIFNLSSTNNILENGNKLFQNTILLHNDIINFLNNDSCIKFINFDYDNKLLNNLTNFFTNVLMQITPEINEVDINSWEIKGKQIFQECIKKYKFTENKFTKDRFTKNNIYYGNVNNIDYGTEISSDKNLIILLGNDNKLYLTSNKIIKSDKINYDGLSEILPIVYHKFNTFIKYRRFKILTSDLFGKLTLKIITDDKKIIQLKTEIIEKKFKKEILDEELIDICDQLLIDYFKYAISVGVNDYVLSLISSVQGTQTQLRGKITKADADLILNKPQFNLNKSIIEILNNIGENTQLYRPTRHLKKDENTIIYDITFTNLLTNHEQKRCLRNNPDIIKSLINKKKFNVPIYNINSQDKYGQTPLHIAVLNYNIDIIEELINNNASSLVKDINGITPKDLFIKAWSDRQKLLSTTNNNDILSSMYKPFTDKLKKDTNDGIQFRNYDMVYQIMFVILNQEVLDMVRRYKYDIINYDKVNKLKEVLKTFNINVDDTDNNFLIEKYVRDNENISNYDDTNNTFILRQYYKDKIEEFEKIIDEFDGRLLSYENELKNEINEQNKININQKIINLKETFQQNIMPKINLQLKNYQNKIDEIDKYKNEIVNEKEQNYRDILQLHQQFLEKVNNNEIYIQHIRNYTSKDLNNTWFMLLPEYIKQIQIYQSNIIKPKSIIKGGNPINDHTVGSVSLGHYPDETDRTKEYTPLSMHKIVKYNYDASVINYYLDKPNEETRKEIDIKYVPLIQQYEQIFKVMKYYYDDMMELGNDLDDNHAYKDMYELMKHICKCTINKSLELDISRIIFEETNIDILINNDNKLSKFLNGDFMDYFIFNVLGLKSSNYKKDITSFDTIQNIMDVILFDVKLANVDKTSEAFKTIEKEYIPKYIKTYTQLFIDMKTAYETFYGFMRTEYDYCRIFLLLNKDLI